MGLFDGAGGYQPTAKDRYHENRAEQTWQRNQRAKEQSDARKILDSIHGLVDKEETKWRRAADDAKKAIASNFAPLERAERTKPVTQYAGGSRAHPAPLIVWHWQCPMPEGCRVKVGGESRRDAGPLLALGPGGGIGSEDIFAAALRGQLGARKSYPEWAKAVSAALRECEQRYPILGRLRDDAFLADLLTHAGVARTEKKNRPEQGAYDLYQRPVTVVHVPVLIGVEVSPDGLELRFSHEAGVTAADWNKQLAGLRSEFGANGVHDASHLRIVEDPSDASIRLLFEDVPDAFPKAVASEPVKAPTSENQAIAAYSSLAWRFGLDARGEEMSAGLRDNPHIALIAQTGWGKSVLSASLIENLRPFGSWWLFDGKGSDHPVQLAQQPGVSWISKTAPEHVIGMKYLWDEMNERYLEADARKAAGRASTAFDFMPIFVLIDETPSLRGGIGKHDKVGADTFDFWVQDLLQKGRQARIHVIIISQSLYVDSVPSEWQMNITRVLFLGPVSGRSLQSDVVPESVRGRIAEMTARIPDTAKGRSVYLDKRGGAVVPVQIQTFFDYAPGSTDLSMAPTPEVRSVWERQQANLEGRARLNHRVGIQVEDAEWRELLVSDLEQLPTVFVADEGGDIDGMSVYDPLSPDFLGKVQLAANKNRARKGAPVTPPAAPKPERGVPVAADEADDDGEVF